MSLNFPEMTEIRLNKAPLSEVICQVQFPPILKINKEIPMDFQDAIRGKYPIFEHEHNVTLPVIPDPSNETPILQTNPVVYQFRSTDKFSTVGLSFNFFAFSTKKYSHWSDFIREFRLVKDTIIEKYSPIHATRIGLRFINTFTCKNTNKASFTEVLDLIRKELTCIIRSEVWSEPLETFSQIVLGDNVAKLVIRYGLMRDQDTPFFVLDFDYFEDSAPIELSGLEECLERYHTRIYQAFRWCLKEESLVAFEPEESK